MRVLIVEDEASLARQLTSSIAEAGYAVNHAADGERADFLAQTEQYDAIVLDLGLPKTDGLTLLRKWRDAGDVAAHRRGAATKQKPTSAMPKTHWKTGIMNGLHLLPTNRLRRPSRPCFKS